MPEALKKKLEGEPLKTYLSLLERVQRSPKKVYAEIKAFSKNHLDVPEVINLLTFAHIRNRKIAAAEKLIQTTFEKHPDYLFARINYADQCLRKKKLEKIPELFPSFNLKQLYPERKVFHTSEFRGYMVFMSYYFLAKKERENALPYFEKAKEVDPFDRSVIFLEKKLFQKSLLRRLLASRKAKP